jgi:hypothetical protein
MEPRVVGDYDSGRNILFTEDHGELGTPEEVDAFLAQYVELLEGIGRRPFLVSKIDELRVKAAVSQYYGDRARAIVERFTLGFARWGSDSWARMTLRTTSRKAAMATQIFDTREQAIAEIERMRAGSGDRPE